MPDHHMMVGIRAWNQQVPIPQQYSGNNAFRLPLQTRFADSPVSGGRDTFWWCYRDRCERHPDLQPDQAGWPYRHESSRRT